MAARGARSGNVLDGDLIGFAHYRASARNLCSQICRVGHGVGSCTPEWRAARRSSAMSVSKAPEGFKVSANLVGKLPASERDQATEHLWVKSGGICALCDQPL